MRSRLLLLIPALGLAACSHRLEGPTPAPGASSPAVVCAEQLDANVTLAGSGFAPLVTKGLEGAPALVLPTVTLVKTQDVEGAAAGGFSYVFPGDPSKAGSERLKWTSQASLAFDLPKDVLEPGLYDIVVENRAGAKGTSKGTLLAVPRPTVTKVVPESICTEDGGSVRVEGDFFLDFAGAAPSVEIGGETFAPTLGDCRTLAGTSGTKACRTLDITVPGALLEAGELPVTITNPTPAACRSEDAAIELVVVPPPVLADVTPAKLCAAGGALTISGQHFREGSTVSLGGVAATNVQFVSATELKATFPAAFDAGGDKRDVTVALPEGCPKTLEKKVEIVQGAQLYFVDPPVAYNGIHLQLTAYGSGLSSAITKVQLIHSDTRAVTDLASPTFDPAKANRLLIDLPSGLEAGTYDLLVVDDSGCPAPLQRGLRIVDELTLTLATIDPPFGWTGSDTGVTVTLAEGSQTPDFQPIPRVYLNPANATAGTRASPLESVTVLSDRTLTAIVPSGRPAGVYDLVVVNPDGSVGVAEDFFTVTQEPPPSIASIAPGSVPKSGTQTFTIRGKDFRASEVKLTCLNPGAAPIELAGTVSSPAATSLTVSFDTDALLTTPTACAVRVTNAEALVSWVDFSALVVTNPAENLASPVASDAANAPSKPLLTARRALGLTAARINNAFRYLFAIGGDDGDPTHALDTVEGTPVDVFGAQGGWTAQRHTMTSKRTFHGVASIGRYVYAIGGSDGTNALATVERAALLDPAFRPDITDLDLNLVDDGLAPGTYYYRVAGVMPDDDAFNPGGETLASERFPVSLPALDSGKEFRLTVHWAQLPGAIAYRVYRSPAAGAAAGEEKLVAEVAATEPRELADDGLPTIDEVPLPIGSLGRWKQVASLNTARKGLAVAATKDLAEANRWWIHAIGGHDGTNAVATLERLQIDIGPNGAQTAAQAWTQGATSLVSARWQLGAWVGTHDTSARIAAGKTFVWLGPGVAANGSTAVSKLEVAELQADGSLAAPGGTGAFPVLAEPQGRRAYASIIAGNFLYALSGGNETDLSVKQSAICTTAGNFCADPAPALKNWNNAVQLAKPRFLAGHVLEGATIYLVGGTGETGTGATATTEQLVW